MLAGAVVMTGASKGKIDWCHFPPGGWTGDPATSHALILSISVNADGTPQGGQHLNHDGDGPLSVLGANCGARTCPMALISTDAGDIPVQLILNNGACVCPATLTPPTALGFCQS